MDQSDVDVFDGPSTQDLGEERAEGVVYSVVLKRVRYGNQSMEPAHSHLRWVSQKVRAVQAGTLEKLVEHLAPEPGVMEVSQAYRTCFLCTYRSFTDPGRVVGLLVKRYLSLSRRPEDTETESASKQSVQQEIISFLRLWLETYPSDFSLHPVRRGSHDLQYQQQSHDAPPPSQQGHPGAPQQGSHDHPGAPPPSQQRSHDHPGAPPPSQQGSHDHPGAPPPSQQGSHEAEPLSQQPSHDLPDAPPPSQQGSHDPKPHPSNPYLASLQPLIQASHDLRKMVSGLQEERKDESNRYSTSSSSGEEVEEQLLDSPHHRTQWRPSQSPLFSMSPEEFSVSLTSEDANLFLAVSPPQCLEYCRAPKDTTNAPTVRACIQHFNRVSLVVIATVLGGVAPDARAFVIGQWIDIAHHCRLVKNFSSLRAIVCGLQSTPVFRLRKSWERVTHSKLHLFEELSDLLSVDYNHQSSRDLLNREGTAKYAEVSMRKRKVRSGSVSQGQSIIGVVPYLGTYLTDLTMIQSAHQDKTQDGLVNFEKFRKLFQLLAELMLYQKSAANYCFCGNEQLLHWLRHTHTSSPIDSYELSKQLEPDDVSNNILMVPSIPLAPISPSRIRRGLRHIFNVKGSSVGDYTPQHASKTLSGSVSARDISSTNNGFSKQGMSRSFSASPSARRRGSAPIGSLFATKENQEGEAREEAEFGGRAGDEEGRVVRIAFSNCDHCNYKSLKLGVGDKTYSIIQQSLNKLGITGESREYDLFLVLGNKHQLIPQNANVYYALSNEQHPTLIINPRT